MSLIRVPGSVIAASRRPKDGKPGEYWEDVGVTTGDVMFTVGLCRGQDLPVASKQDGTLVLELGAFNGRPTVRFHAFEPGAELAHAA